MGRETFTKLDTDNSSKCRFMCVKFYLVRFMLASVIAKCF